MATSGDIVVEPSTSTDVRPSKVQFGPDPVEIKCPECDEVGETEIFYQSGVFTYGLCLLLLFMGLWLGCFAIPFCVPRAKDCVHKCSKCETEVGRFRRYDKEISDPYR
ncbi:lipopolysaccharide-induced tumor necrosis factor-alpha factor homolog [Crassostrea virginica]